MYMYDSPMRKFENLSSENYSVFFKRRKKVSYRKILHILLNKGRLKNWKFTFFAWGYLTILDNKMQL